MTTIASLTLVLGLLAGLLWWLRRVAGPGPGPGRHVQVVETITLAPGRSLHLVRVADRWLLIASSAQRCELLCELESLPADRPEAEPSWIEVLRSRLGRA